VKQIDEENIYHWNLALMVLNPDSLYYGGYFKAQMSFPKDYPYKPPGQSRSVAHFSTWLTHFRFPIHQTIVAPQYLRRWAFVYFDSPRPW